MENKVGRIIFKIVSIFLIVMILILIINISNNKIIEIGIQTGEKVEAIDEQQTAINKKITDLKEGEYIKYDTGVTTVGDNGVITCVVLYDSTSPYGVQIISEKTVGQRIGIGDKDNFNNAVKEHNNAIAKLNNEAAKYLNRKYATNARSVGSVPNNPNSETRTYYKTKATWAKAINGILKDKDNNYLEDDNKMTKLGIKYVGENYWLASREIIVGDNLEGGIIRYVLNGAGSVNWYTCGIYSPETIYGNTKFNFYHNLYLRPCFTLKNDIIITGGDGKTEETAYTISDFDFNEKREITIGKIWNDDNNITGVRPNQVELTLVANGEETQTKLIVSEENNWSTTLTDLNKYDENGNEIIYTVIEKEVPEHYIKTENGLTVTNTIDYESMMIDVILKKYEEGTTIGVQGAVIEINNEIGDSIKVTTDEKGEASFRVVSGKYKYKEIVAPNGYILNNKIYNFTVSKDGIVIYEDDTNGIIYNKKENQPDTPNNPDNPDNPNNPNNPDNPDNPNDPDNPDNPNNPDNPDTPNTPNTPNIDGKIQGNDTTKTEGKLPQTGETLNFAIIISSLIIICIYNLIKIKNYKEIK